MVLTPIQDCFGESAVGDRAVASELEKENEGDELTSGEQSRLYADFHAHSPNNAQFNAHPFRFV